MITDLKSHYRKLLEQYGPSPAAVQYSNQESQFKRFEVLAEVDKNIDSVIDVGCGLGDMYEYLLQTKFSGRYLGLDFIDEFVELAKNKYSNNPNVEFAVCDLAVDAIPQGYDYILLSGVFNNKVEQNKKFMLDTIEKIFDSCNKGIAFNAMSTYVDYEDEELFYSNPLEIFDFCKRNITPRVILKHDYLVKKGSVPFEYTLYLYKDEMK
jgi:SAM-dependent methyltransferase